MSGTAYDWGKRMKRFGKIKNVALLQGVIVIYTISSVMSKEASASGGICADFCFSLGWSLYCSASMPFYGSR